MSEQELLRMEKKSELESLGICTYPSKTVLISDYAQDLHNEFQDKETVTPRQVSLAGRLMSRRIMGTVSFVDLQDTTGKIQLYIHRDTLCPGEDKTAYNKIFKKLLDLGDIVSVSGRMFRTKVGDLAVHVTELTLLAKALKPLPVTKEVITDSGRQTYDAFTNPEHCYRQRYVDLAVNPEVRKKFKQRTELIRSMRAFMDAQGYLEVETPILQPLHGGASARPFTTHHNALNIQLYLRIANELYLKRLIVGGYDGVYEFAKDFRNEGMSRFHNPEFTMLEIYIAYKDYQWMMEFTEQMITKAAMDLHGQTLLEVGENRIDFQRPWKRYTMFEAITHFTGIDISKMNEEALRKAAKQLSVPLGVSDGKGKIIDEIFCTLCEPHLIQPTFITDYPVEMSPLAKQHRDNPMLVERFEVFCNGKEICNAYSELNDPIEQRIRFEQQSQLATQGDQEAMQLDEDFLQALSYGMPPTAGLGIGIDRLAMIMTNANSIQDVLFFPQMRPLLTTTLVSQS